jgi:hypothetical protein
MPAPKSATPVWWVPPISDGTAEALKWLALLLMTLDHVNKYLLHGAVAPLFCAGRLVLPLFAFLLAAQLARQAVWPDPVHARVLRRLAAAGLVTSVPFMGLGGLAWGWYPLNVMATLACGTGIVWLLDLGGQGRVTLAFVVFVVGGALVEFWWPGIAVFVAAWWFARRPGLPSAVGGFLALASLVVVNGNGWALLSAPLLAVASTVGLKLPRARHLFYAYYPLHLGVLWGVKALL